MIIEYHRPTSMEEALLLLNRSEPRTVPMGGGTTLARLKDENLAVVDLQALDLKQITAEGQILRIGAACSLESLLEAAETPAGLKEALFKEQNPNLRRMATVAGSLVVADGRSPFAAAMLAFDTRISISGESQPVALGDWLPMRNAQASQLITDVVIPLNAELQVETIGRTPLDRPVVIIALARWPSGRLRMAVGGFGSTPWLALDGPEPGGAEEAVHGAFAAANDSWASSEYRQEAAAAIVRRLLA